VKRRRAFGLLAGAVSLWWMPVHVHPYEEVPEPPSESEPVLAVVSPLVFPVCAVSGTASLLVPILGGAAGEAAGVDLPVRIDDAVLGALGPVYLACGTLPPAPGTSCQLDADLGIVWSGAGEPGGPLPPVVGGVVDSSEAAAAAVGLPPGPLSEALECAVPASAPAPAPPSAPPPEPAVGAVGSGGPERSASAPAAAPSGATASSPNGPGRTISGVVPPELAAAPPTAPGVPAAQVVSALRSPSGLGPLQLLLALALGTFLAGSWIISFRELRMPSGTAADPVAGA
jgi:hypothetical protein